MIFALTGCKSKTPVASKQEVIAEEQLGKIYLYGEMHGKKAIMEKELEHWGTYYQQDEMRHLFVELPYYTAEFLNLWMKEADDTQLDLLYSEWFGTAMYVEDTKDFFRQIKALYPETIFHGTDVGHQYDTTGERFLAYLEDHNLKDSEAYKRTQEVIKQGKLYYGHDDAEYRETKMIENFKLAFDSLEGESIMGIYGAYHIGVNAPKDELIMINALIETYGEQLSSEDLSQFTYITKPLSVESVEISGVTYEASYFGKADLTGFKDYAYREFWRIENAFDAFQTLKKTGDYLPFDNYPMVLHEKEVYKILYMKIDGSSDVMYYVTEGEMANGEGKTLNVQMP